EVWIRLVVDFRSLGDFGSLDTRPSFLLPRCGCGRRLRSAALPEFLEIDCSGRHIPLLGNDDAVFTNHKTPAEAVFEVLEDRADGDFLFQMEVDPNSRIQVELRDQVESRGMAL